MAIKFNPLTSNFDLVSHGSLATDDHTQYALLAGRSSGQTLNGGTATSDSLTLHANSATWDNNNTGRISLKDPMEFNRDGATLTPVVQGFFQISSVTAMVLAGTYTGNSANNVSVRGFSAIQTLRYDTSQALASAPVFTANFIIQPTAATTDVASFWSGFAATPKYMPDLSTAVTASTTNFSGYDSEPYVSMSGTSHASAVALVNDLYAYGAFPLTLFANTEHAQASVTNATGYLARNPKANVGTVTNLRGAAIAEMTRATNNINLLLGTTTSPVGQWEGDWNIYSPSARKNVLGGELEIRDDNGLIIPDSNNDRWRITVSTAGAVTTTKLTFEPDNEIAWYALYRASEISGVSDGADVTTWNDESANDYHLTLGGGTDVPTYEDSRATLNNKPAVLFTRANSQSLERTGVTAITVATTFSIIAVVELNSVANVMRILGHNAGANRGFGTTATPNWSTQMGATAANAGTPATGTKYFVRVYATNTAHTIFVDEVSTATTATSANNLAQIVVGASRTAAPAYSNYLDGYVAFLGIYSGDITADTNWARFKTWANSEWGFSL